MKTRIMKSFGPDTPKTSICGTTLKVFKSVFLNLR